MSWEENVTNTVNKLADEIEEIRRFQAACDRDKDIGMLMQLNESESLVAFCDRYKLVVFCQL